MCAAVALVRMWSGNPLVLIPSSHIIWKQPRPHPLARSTFWHFPFHSRAQTFALQRHSQAALAWTVSSSSLRATYLSCCSNESLLLASAVLSALLAENRLFGDPSRR